LRSRPNVTSPKRSSWRFSARRKIVFEPATEE
jgi:hypothetical protein